MNSSALVLGFLMCTVGLTVGFVLLEPLGFVLDGLGLMVFIYGIFAKHERDTRFWKKSSDHTVHGSSDENKCAYCVFFGLDSCPRHETLLNAIPCDKFDLRLRR